jgi:hypothetical protein
LRYQVTLSSLEAIEFDEHQPSILLMFQSDCVELAFPSDVAREHFRRALALAVHNHDAKWFRNWEM